jgi:hypothetical protein
MATLLSTAGKDTKGLRQCHLFGQKLRTNFEHVLVLTNRFWAVGAKPCTDTATMQANAVMVFILLDLS